MQSPVRGPVHANQVHCSSVKVLRKLAAWTALKQQQKK